MKHWKYRNKKILIRQRSITRAALVWYIC